MAAISSSPPSPIAAPLAGARSTSSKLPLFILHPFPLRSPSRPIGSLRLHSSNPSSDANGSLNNHSPSFSAGAGEELGRPLRPPPVFVSLPVDAVKDGQMSRPKVMGASFMALATAGIEGVSIEIWWGIVERDTPGVYDWSGYLDLVTLARRHGLKVRAIMAFHQCRSPHNDKPCWIPLPRWVLEEIDKEPDLAYTDRFGRRNKEYISLGCDTLPVLRGRSPIHAYSDFMRSFRDTFRDFLGIIVTEIQIGMGPEGELRYPSIHFKKLTGQCSVPEFGEFQCYDKYMLESLSAYARDVGIQEWAYGGPLDASNFSQNPEHTTFFKSDGTWNTAYGQFFLEWYSGMLLRHGERLCMVTDAIFWRTGVNISAKIAAMHCHYFTISHPSELTTGYFNTIARDGYLPITTMLGRYRMTLCCTCFDLQDAEEKNNSTSSPEGYLKQLIYAAKICNLPLCGENSLTKVDDASLKQVIKSCMLYYNGARDPSLSFNYVRMHKNLFEPRKWNSFTRFVKQMSDARTFQGKTGLSSFFAADDVRRAYSYH